MLINHNTLYKSNTYTVFGLACFMWIKSNRFVDDLLINSNIKLCLHFSTGLYQLVNIFVRFT